MITNWIMLFTIILALVIFVCVYNEVDDFIDTYIWIFVSGIILSVISILYFIIHGVMKRPFIGEKETMIKNSVKKLI